MFKCKRGFTLIELLVVIAIIAILAAILFPVFAKAREKGRQSACTSNLKQISTAIYLYTQDYDETLPPSWGGGNQNYWFCLINPYFKNVQPADWSWSKSTMRKNNSMCFLCPSAAKYPPQDWNADSAVNYGYNIKYGYYPFVTSTCKSLAFFNNPADSFIIVDAKTSAQIIAEELTSQNKLDAYCDSRHNGGFNVLWVDGHVTWRNSNAVFSVNQTKGY
ncbi:MAG: DUF1559 domain-containing protein [Armatimonadota bacterium]